MVAILLRIQHVLQEMTAYIFPHGWQKDYKKDQENLFVFFFLRERELRSCLSHGMAKKKGGGEI